MQKLIDQSRQTDQLPIIYDCSTMNQFFKKFSTVLGQINIFQESRAQRLSVKEDPGSGFLQIHPI